MNGLSKPRLERMRHVLCGYMDRGEMPGLVALVARQEEVHISAIGTSAIGSSVPMRRDTIFRIASLSKVVTAVAAMMLVDEAKLRLDESIEPWIPELANRRVLKSIDSPVTDTVPANRSITVRDLLTYRMGFGSVMAPPDTYPIQKLIREHRIGGDGPPMPRNYPTSEEWIQSLSSLPLMAQPGERWLYNTSCDVLGLLIARVSGQNLGTFFRKRIFEPLGMKDTAFNVPAVKVPRLSTSYRLDPNTQSLEVYDDAANSAWGPEPPFESAAGGLVSTMDDYFAFSKMLLSHGRGGREPILSRRAWELMTAVQVAKEQLAGAEMFFGETSSWGFGVSVDTARTDMFRTPGRFGWDGGLGTSAYVDPIEGMIGILFTPRMMDSPKAPRVYTDFWTMAYAASE